MPADSQPDLEAAARAERQTDIHFDFELEDIVAGNAPASETGKAILAIVEDAQAFPTQGKIEAALLPLHEAMLAERYHASGGRQDPPRANRHTLKEHGTKVIQARKVRRTAQLRANRPSRKQTVFQITGFHVGIGACLIGIIL